MATIQTLSQPPIPVSLRSPANDRGVASLVRRRATERWVRARKAEIDYARKLRGVARQCGEIVKAFAPDGVVSNPHDITQHLQRYAELLRPWARAVGIGMLRDVERRDASAWFEHSREMGRLLREEIESAPTGEVMREALERQVTLITSLPIEAGQRVHRLTTESLINGSRASEIAKEILASGEVTASRATLIARTETARSASELTKARALAAGITHYMWHAQLDSDTRPGHRALHGKIFRFDDPPEVNENGRYMKHGPGEIWNCRCFAVPQIPADL
jgi:SPP1 gp7 family putative phage head morphogenesis protein